MLTSRFPGALGLVAYPGQGLAKSLHSAIHSKTRKQLLKARLRESGYLARQSAKAQSRCPELLEAFEDLQRQPVITEGSTNLGRENSQGGIQRG